MSFGALRAVARAGILAFVDACGVELAAHNRVLHADVLDAPTAQEDDRVLLEVVPLAGDVGSDLHAIGEPDASNLADGGVRLAGGLGGHLGAHPALEG